jgi:hypothetical protein
MNNLFNELDPKLEANQEQKEYKKNILESDFLFPDGIGLQVFYLILNLFSKIKKSLRSKINVENKDIYFLKNLN